MVQLYYVSLLPTFHWSELIYMTNLNFKEAWKMYLTMCPGIRDTQREKNDWGRVGVKQDRIRKKS